jgi:hypothetical protein
MGAVFNMRRMTITSTGTGTITLGVASAGWRAFTAAPAIPTGAILSYRIDDDADWEVGVGVYNSAAGTLSRTLRESSTGALLAVTTSGFVTLVPLAEDFDIPGSYPNLARAAGPAIYEQFDHFLPTSASNSLGSFNRGSTYTEAGATQNTTGTYTGGTTADAQTGVLAVRFAIGSNLQRPTFAFTDDRFTVSAGNGITHIVSGSIKLRPANAPTAPSATNDYWVSLGFGASSSDRVPNSLIKLDYYFNGTAPVFEARTRENGGSITTTSLTVPASDTYVTWSILVNGLNVEFWVGGVLVATRTLTLNNLSLRPMLLGHHITSASQCGYDADWGYIAIKGMTR